VQLLCVFRTFRSAFRSVASAMKKSRPAPPRPRRSPPPRPQRRVAAPRVSSPPPSPKRAAKASASAAAFDEATVRSPRHADKPKVQPAPKVQPPAQPVLRRPAAPSRNTRARAAAARERREAVARRASHMQELHPGDVVADRYRVEAIMGRSQGMLLDCSHTGFDQRVAMRVISPALADAKAVDRFQREIRLLSKLETAHAARIIDVGTLPNGALFLAREHLDGTTLADEARGHGLPVQQAIDVFLQVAEAVAEAHSHGVVLRDLQSSHVFLTRKRNGEPVAKLTDFGTCKVIKKRDGEMSCTRLLGLSPSASPELIRQQSDIDERADIWSLACMLYELVTGGPAFIGEGTALMLAIAKDAPVPPSSLRRDVDVPTDLDNVILRALNKRPADRYNSIYQMVRGLRRYASPRGQVLVEQIARLAGEEPTALSRPGNAIVVADEDTDDSMSFAVSVNPPEPAMRPSVPSMTPVLPHAMPVPAVPSSPTPMVAASQPSANRQSWSTGLRPHPVAVQTFPWETQPMTPRHAKLKVAAVMAMLPLGIVLMVIALAGETRAATAHAALSLPSFDAIAAEIPADETDADELEDRAVEERAVEERAAEAAHAAEAPQATAPATRRSAKRQARDDNQFLGSLGSKKKKTSKRRKTRSKSKKADEPKKASSSDKPATGQLAAMAVGASCAFAVDGAPHGSSSSVRVTVPAGVHRVSCAPVNGASRSRSVTVKPGKVSVAVFKF
jgi:eukaryotic-like serine/threonine-protein kinase